MEDQDEIARIRAYFQQHQATYNRDVLRQKLIEDGYDEQDVDAVLGEMPMPQRAATTGISAWMALVLMLTIVGVVILNSSVCITTSANGDLLPITLLTTAELVALFVLWRRGSPLATSLLIGLFLWGIPTVILILILRQLT